MSFEILKDIPLPSRWDKNRKYPWYDLEVGDCVVIPDRIDWKRFRNSVHYLNSKCQDLMFTTKVQNGKLHIWRVK